MPKAAATPDVAEIDIDATPEDVWDLVSDVTQMGQWSPECFRCRWLDGGTGPRQGARFKGWNRQALGPLPIRWSTVSTVVDTQRGEVFSFFTKDSGATWTYRIEARAEGGTHVVETRDQGDKPFVARAFATVMPGRDELQRDGMVETLQRLKHAAEA